MSPLSLRDKYTVVTGASSGLGLELARQIARDHHGHLVLVARRKERLEELSSELCAAHGVDVVCIPADMTNRKDVERVLEESTRGRTIHAAILNAGITYFGPGLDLDFDEFERMLATNVTSVVWHAQKYLRAAVEAASGGAVMIVSSMAGVSPTPYQAAYSGTKAFLNNYGLALGEELKGTGVSLSVFAPGGIATEMGEKSGTARKFKKGDIGMMDVDVCARLALKGMIARDRFIVPGALNRLNDVVLRFTPRTLATRTAAKMFEGALPPRS